MSRVGVGIRGKRWSGVERAEQSRAGRVGYGTVLYCMVLYGWVMYGRYSRAGQDRE